jgi:hypothetical protein
VRKQYVIIEAWVYEQGEVGIPGYPDQGLPPGIGGGPIEPPPGVGGGPVIPGYPERPGHPLPWPGYPGRPGQGLPRPPMGRPEFPWVPGGEGPETGLPGTPEFPWVPGGGFPGFPGRPGQGLPIPEGRFSVWPVVDAEDVGGHPLLPDMSLPGLWVRVAVNKAASYPAWVTYPHGPEEEGHEEVAPTRGAPGNWVTILWYDQVVWAWVPDISAPSIDLPEVPSVPEREPKV